jgi:hypothetical protein
MENNTTDLGVWIKRTSAYLGVRMEENIYLNGSMDRREYPPTGKNGWKRISAPPPPHLGVWIEKNILLKRTSASLGIWIKYNIYLPRNADGREHLPT